jgi:acyl-[acyl-carrier-protein]-phospholipid O-acyltransferase/long-chain-fatty-acid--[acyl-carrier-protein] ligase
LQKIFKHIGFIPFIFVVFLNSFTDLGHKIIIQNSLFKNFDGTEQIIYISIINSLIILPFILLFTPSGWLGDRYPKNKTMVYASGAAIIITSLITLSYYQGWFEIAFALTFIMAAQSALYSPAKYGYIKDLVGKENISNGNAIIQSITIGSILLSSLFYSYFFETRYIENTSLSQILQDIAPIGFLLIGFSVLEFILALRLPQKTNERIEVKFNKKEYIKGKTLFNTLKNVKQNETIWLSIIGVSIFWGVSQSVLAIFPSYVKDYLFISDTIVVQGIMAMTAFGIILGSLYTGKVSKYFIETGVIPLGAIGLSISLFLVPNTTNILFLTIEFFTIGFFGGMFLVPLNSLIQFNSNNDNLGKIIASNNFMNSIFMLLFLSITTIFAIYSFDSIHMFYFLSFIVILGSLYSLSKTPQAFISFLLKKIVSTKYKIQINGIKNIPSTGGVLLLGNHTSWIDWAILQMTFPRNIRFVMDRNIYEKWYLTWFFKIFNLIPISPRSSRGAMKEIAEHLKKGEIVCLFPEGYLSKNGQLLEFKKGFELVFKDDEEMNDIPILPFYIRGLWGSTFSNANDKLKNSLNDDKKYRDITVVYGQLINDNNLKTSENIKQIIAKLSVDAWEIYTNQFKPIHISFLYTAKKYSNELATADSTRTSLSYSKLLTSVILFRNYFETKFQSNNIGLILPSSVAGIIANLSVLTLGKTVVNINYTSSINSLKKALELSEVKDIIVSEKFINKLKSKGFPLDEIFIDKNIYVLEDIKKEFKKVNALKILLLTKILPTKILQLLYFKNNDIQETAAILFSSGSEGTPKGIELSHKNIIANIKQTSSILNPNEKDVIMGTLPLFHAMGLTATTFMPVIEGIPVICHPDPTDGAGVSKLVAKYGGTILIGTSTFFRLYLRNRKVHPLMLKSLRIIVAGAEKLSEEVKKGWKEKYGLDIFEGYGTTETAPIVSVNLPDYLHIDDMSIHLGNKIGTVGLPLPGTKIKIVDPHILMEYSTILKSKQKLNNELFSHESLLLPSIEELPIGEGGMILIGGPQVMKGYLKEINKTNEVILVDENNYRWYITGDKGKIDNDGFLTILDRYSRFAKLGGEMVSLTAVEEEIRKIINNSNIEVCASNFPDTKKGEKIIIGIQIPSDLEFDLKDFKSNMNKQIENKLMIPNEIIEMEIPKLGSGKVDFKMVKKELDDLLKKQNNIIDLI